MSCYILLVEPAQAAENICTASNTLYNNTPACLSSLGETNLNDNFKEHKKIPRLLI